MTSKPKSTKRKSKSKRSSRNSRTSRTSSPAACPTATRTAPAAPSNSCSPRSPLTSCSPTAVTSRRSTMPINRSSVRSSRSARAWSSKNAELEQQKTELETLRQQQADQLSDMQAKQGEVQTLVDGLSSDVKEFMAQRDAEYLAAVEEEASPTGGSAAAPAERRGERRICPATPRSPARPARRSAWFPAVTPCRARRRILRHVGLARVRCGGLLLPGRQR